VSVIFQWQSQILPNFTVSFFRERIAKSRKLKKHVFGVSCTGRYQNLSSSSIH